MRYKSDLFPFSVNTNTSTIYKLAELPENKALLKTTYRGNPKKRQYYVAVKNDGSLNESKMFTIHTFTKLFFKGYFINCRNLHHARWNQAILNRDKAILKSNEDSLNHWNSVLIHLEENFPEDII